MIELSNITKEYHMGTQTVHALRGLSLTVDDGEYVAIMGPSGSGKSTLMHIIGCLDQPTSGTYKLDGVDVSQMNDNQLARIRNKRIGFVFQNYNLLPRTPAIKQVALPLVYAGYSRRERLKRAEEALRAVGLGHRMGHRPDELSGGQQQRVAIARSLANQPAVLLCDEPTGNLDLATGQGILEVLQKLNEQKGVTVICATHDHRMLDICDRLMWIRDGRIERIARRDEVHVEIGSIGGETT